MKLFDTVEINRTTVMQKDGIEIRACIAGVNSGAYELPFVIQVRTWASKWFFKKFFYREMRLNIHEVIALKEECDKVIEWHNSRTMQTLMNP
jgi:hypothetical protein